jgi:hypothetical protein
MDTQIALYDAASCEALLSKDTAKFKLLAANDDYFQKEKFFAAALQNVPLTEGKTYYLQMDGSAGGDEGDFFIEIWNAPVGNEQIKMSGSPEIYIFPNPTADQVKLYIKETPANFRITIIDVTGKSIINDEIKSHKGIFEKSYMIPEKGLYFLKVTGNGINYTKKIIRQ